MFIVYDLTLDNNVILNNQHIVIVGDRGPILEYAIDNAIYEADAFANEFARNYIDVKNIIIKMNIR